jgi:DNA-binding transcriptional regulator YiaG
LTQSVSFDTRSVVTSKQVVALRKTLGMTQQRLADRIGAQRHTVARWELGQNEPRGANLKALIELQAGIKTKTRQRKRK